MLKLIANYDPVLKGHLVNPRQKNVTYVSPRIQNKINDIIGKHIIQKSILEQLEKPNSFQLWLMKLLLTTWKLCLCVLGSDSDKCIREARVCTVFYSCKSYRRNYSNTDMY